MAAESEARPWRAAIKGLAALALWPAIAGCLPSLGYLVGQNWLLPAWLLGGGVAAWAAWRLGRWRALLLCALYAAGSFFLTSLTFLGQSSDYISYHLPQVFLLEAGWNPALQGSLEAVEALGITPLDTFRPFHTICFPLFGAQWSAGTDLATGALHGFNWLVALLLPGAGYLSLRTLSRCFPALRPWQIYSLTLLLLLLDHRLIPAHFPLDGALYLLLLAWVLMLLAHLTHRATSLEQGLLVALPMLLAGVKQSTAVPVVLGFGFLLLQALLQRDWRRFRVRLYLGLLALFAIALLWFHPYLTNAFHYGSPLFPAHSFLPAYQGLDVTADLHTLANNTAHSPLATFLSANWVWTAQAAILGLITYWQRALRPLFAIATLLLLTALLMPWWLYTYARYTPATPIIAILLLCALPALSPHLPLRRLLQTTLLCSVLLSLWVYSQGRDGRATSLTNTLIAAANLQSILYFPEHSQSPTDRLLLVSSKARGYPKDSPFLTHPRLYPLRDHAYALRELLTIRGGHSISEDFDLDHLTRLRGGYIAPADLALFLPQSSPYAKRLYPWDKPLSCDTFRHLARALPRNFSRRWLERRP